jgi:small subunit ribosomal protein S19
MAKEFRYRGKSLDELQKLSLEEFAKLAPSRERRKLKRGLTIAEKTFVREITKRDNVQTQCRDMVIIPSFVGKTVKVYDGKEFQIVKIEPDMLAHRLGEFALTRKKVSHSAPGIGATRSSAALSVR